VEFALQQNSQYLQNTGASPPGDGDPKGLRIISFRGKIPAILSGNDSLGQVARQDSCSRRLRTIKMLRRGTAAQQFLSVDVVIACAAAFAYVANRSCVAESRGAKSRVAKSRVVEVTTLPPSCHRTAAVVP
jgi:hypothetical protein